MKIIIKPLKPFQEMILKKIEEMDKMIRHNPGKAIILRPRCPGKIPMFHMKHETKE